MGAALTATHHLLGRNGKAVPWLGPRVFRAGTDAAPMGCLQLKDPSRLAVPGLRAATTPGTGQGPGQWLPRSPGSTNPKPIRASPVNVAAPSLAAAMTMLLSQLAPWGKAVWAGPATPIQCGVYCPVLTGRAETGLPAGTLWHQWAGVTAFGMAAATVMPITLHRSKNA